MKKVTISLAFLCMCASIHAQQKTLNLQQCLNMAFDQSYQMQAANKSVERAKTLQATAWDIDKTDLSLSQDPSSGGSTDNAVSVTQGIEFPTLYAARHKQLKAETQAERSQANVVKSELASNVKSAYYQLVYEEEQLRILAKQDSILSRYRTVAESRVKAGETRKLEQLAAERMHRENRLEMISLQSQIEGTQQELMSYLNVDSPIEPADKSLQAIDFVQNGYNYQQTPEGQLAQDKLTVADKAVTVAKNGYAPSLSVSLRTQLVFTSWDPYHINRSKFDKGNFMGFEVGVGVPLFYGATKARVKAAKKDREIAEIEMKQEQQAKQREYNATLSKCNAAYAKLSYYQEEGGEKDKELERLSRLEYENGEIPYTEYMDALNDCIDFHMKKAAAINDYNQNVIALEKLMGNNIK